MSAGDWVSMIAAGAAAFVLIINALGTHWGRKDIKALMATVDTVAVSTGEQTKKLEVIHDLTNSSMDDLKKKLAAALIEISKLEGLLAARNRWEGRT